MYGAEWLIVMALLGLAAGAAGGFLLGRQLGGGQRLRELEEQLAAARRQYEDYRHEVVTQFSETARKFQTLNDSYTDLHRQLAKSSSILCGDVSGPLLAAPSGHQDLLTDRARESAAPAETADGAGTDTASTDHPASTGGAKTGASTAEQPSESPAAADAAAEPVGQPIDEPAGKPVGKPEAAADEEPPTLRERVERAAQSPRAEAAPPGTPTLSDDIRVAEPADPRGALLRPSGPAAGAAAPAGGTPEPGAADAPETRSAGAGRS